MKPQERARILGENPGVELWEIDEYERLLAERFATDPDLPPTPATVENSERREARIAELYERLFRPKVTTARSAW